MRGSLLEIPRECVEVLEAAAVIGRVFDDVDRHGGKVPRDRASLEALPGVGRKTANVVLNVAFGEPTMAVDTHIFRVSNRTRIAEGRNPLCGDAFEVWVSIEDGVVREVTFHGQGCAISKASASMMTTVVKGKPIA